MGGWTRKTALTHQLISQWKHFHGLTAPLVFLSYHCPRLLYSMIINLTSVLCPVNGFKTFECINAFLSNFSSREFALDELNIGSRVPAVHIFCMLVTLLVCILFFSLLLAICTCPWTGYQLLHFSLNLYLKTQLILSQSSRRTFLESTITYQ